MKGSNNCAECVFKVLNIKANVYIRTIVFPWFINRKISK